jgi:hypothetical protein
MIIHNTFIVIKKGVMFMATLTETYNVERTDGNFGTRILSAKVLTYKTIEEVAHMEVDINYYLHRGIYNDFIIQPLYIPSINFLDTLNINDISDKTVKEDFIIKPSESDKTSFTGYLLILLQRTTEFKDTKNYGDTETNNTVSNT